MIQWNRFVIALLRDKVACQEPDMKRCYQMIRATDPEFRETLPASLARQMVSDESKLLTESELPVAIFHGEHDSLINYDYYQNLAIPDLWNQKATLIRNASHSPHIEAPQEFNRLLVQFISDVNY